MGMFVPLCFLLLRQSHKGQSSQSLAWEDGNSKLKIDDIQEGKFQHTGRCDYSSLGMLV